MPSVISAINNLVKSVFEAKTAPADIRPHTSQPTDRFQLFIHYGRRQAQPARGPRFIDLAVERLGTNRDFLLSREELAGAAASGVALAG